MAEATSKKIIEDEPKYYFGDATPNFTVNIVFPTQLQLPAHSEEVAEEALPTLNEVNEIQEQYLEDYFGDYIFIVCEDGDTLITNEEGNAVFVQEYFE